VSRYPPRSRAPPRPSSASAPSPSARRSPETTHVLGAPAAGPARQALQTCRGHLESSLGALGTDSGSHPHTCLKTKLARAFGAG
jgi:hypothetical protein